MLPLICVSNSYFLLLKSYLMFFFFNCPKRPDDLSFFVLPDFFQGFALCLYCFLEYFIRVIGAWKFRIWFNKLMKFSPYWLTSKSSVVSLLILLKSWLKRLVSMFLYHLPNLIVGIVFREVKKYLGTKANWGMCSDLPTVSFR